MPEVLPADVLGPTLPVLQRDEDVSPVSWGAQHLVSHLFHRIHSKFDHVQECGRKAAMARVYAAAAASTQFQQNNIREVVKLIARMRDHGEWDPILMLEHVRYDETPLDMRVYTGEGFDRECSKVFVVERGYSMLVHCNAVGRMPDARPKIGEGLFVLDVYMSPAMRSAANTSGETIQKLLSTLNNVSAEAAATFKHVVRLAEVDESGANLRAELFEMALMIGRNGQACSPFACATKRGLKSHDSQTRDRILGFFLRLEIGQFSPICFFVRGGDFLTKLHCKPEEKGKNRLESSGDGAPEFLDFCPLSWSSTS